MKTVFLTIFQGVEAKNLLRTSVLAHLLADPDLRLVFFVRSAERADYYRREFSDPRIIYEAADFASQGFFDRILSLLKFQMIRTSTTDLRRRMELDASGNAVKYFFSFLLNRLIARPLARRIIRWFDECLIRDRRFAPFFERYRPSAVFLAHLFDDAEVSLLREAKRYGIPTVGFINSWDKLTARSAIRILPNELLVYNNIVRAEAIAHADMPPERIRVVGIPQYDLYRNFQPIEREAFIRGLGLDPAKRLLLYAPMGETFSSADWNIIDLLHRWQSDGTLPREVELFVRFQPNDFVDQAELASRPWLRYDRPGKRFGKSRGVDWDMSAEELRHLANTLAHTDLLVCYASSISVDAACLSKPVININFELERQERLGRSPTQFYAMEHYRKALETGGIRLVNSADDLASWIRRYLQDPALDREGRRRLVAVECGPFDGRAGARIAGRITLASRKGARPAPAPFPPLARLAGLGALSLLVGVLYVLPPLIISRHLERAGQPYVLSLENSRNDLAYLTWAREIYDGHFPPRDPFSEENAPILQNPLPSLILAGFIGASDGRIVSAYLWAILIFAQVNFFVFYFVIRRLTGLELLAVCLALIAVLTPVSLRILNFDGTA